MRTINYILDHWQGFGVFPLQPDWMLRDYRWYRVLRGGVWYNITPRMYMSIWQREPANGFNEITNRVEMGGVEVTSLMGY